MCSQVAPDGILSGHDFRDWAKTTSGACPPRARVCMCVWERVFVNKCVGSCGDGDQGLAFLRVFFAGDVDWSIQPDGSRHPEWKAVKGAVIDFATQVCAAR